MRGECSFLLNVKVNLGNPAVRTHCGLGMNGRRNTHINDRILRNAHLPLSVVIVIESIRRVNIGLSTKNQM